MCLNGRVRCQRPADHVSCSCLYKLVIIVRPTKVSAERTADTQGPAYHLALAIHTENAEGAVTAGDAVHTDDAVHTEDAVTTKAVSGGWPCAE